MSNLLPFPAAPDPEQRPTNQGHFIPPAGGYVWQGLRFRTESEVAIARELDAAKLTFWPCCACRITGAGGQRETREPDFLIVHQGVVAMLELDGKPHEGRAADDHRRDRMFELRAGIWVIERVPSQYALHHPRRVVRGLLRLIEQYQKSA
jgi:hypothetical protein